MNNRQFSQRVLDSFSGITEKGLTDKWRRQMSQRITDCDQIPFAWMTQVHAVALKGVCKRFPMFITPYYLSLINPNDPDDPLLKQVLPSVKEMSTDPVSFEDPLNEEAYSPVKGLTHRYPDRALLCVTTMCAVYCRHCTRKREWGTGKERTLTEGEIERAAEYIREHDEIKDVLISGGDPLTLPDRYLEYALQKIRGIPHVEILRIGTRAPVVLPQRITPSLLEVMERYGPIWLNTQFNHPREITNESAHACDLLLRAGIPVSNQTVLLRGVNDSPEIIQELNRKLLRIKVRPYYLLQCDPVVGSKHFRTSVWKGVEIMEHLRGSTSGLAIPHFVIDLPGGGGKVPLLPDYILSREGDRIIFRNYKGEVFIHHEPQGE